MRTGELDDPALFRPLPYRIYLPGCYAEWPEAHFPTLYLLHGLQATDAQWDDLGADDVAARLIASGEIPPLIIVMPWERRGLDYESAIADVLVPWVDASFRTIPSREGRAIGGLSRGAGWALRIAFQHPGLFSALGLHSPAILSPDLYNLPFWLEGLSPQDLPRIWIDIGDRDPLRPSTLELAAIFDQAEVAYAWHPNQGYHAPDYWASHMQEYLIWYSLGWE
jgi:enterochelin esterase-like enzyme